MFSDLASIFKAGLGIAALTGAYLWHAGRVDAYADEVLGLDVAARARGELILTEANIKLKESGDALKAENKALGDLVDRLSAGDQLRQQEVERFKRDLQGATETQLREFASAADANFQRSRNHIERFGREAIECSITAHTQAREAAVIDASWQAYIDALKGTTK